MNRYDRYTYAPDANFYCSHPIVSSDFFAKAASSSKPTLSKNAINWVYDSDGDWDSQPPSCDQSGELTDVDMDKFLATF